MIENEGYYRQVLKDISVIGKGNVRLNGQTFDQLKADLTYLATQRGMQIECKRGKDDRVLVVHTNREKRKKFDFSGLQKAGDSKVFDVNYEREAYFRSKASSHAKSIGLSSSVKRVDKDHLDLTLIDPATRSREKIRKIPKADVPAGRPPLPPDQLKYPFATLEVGQSALIEVPKSEYSKVRGSASSWATRYRMKFSCNAESNGIRVTRTA